MSESWPGWTTTEVSEYDGGTHSCAWLRAVLCDSSAWYKLAGGECLGSLVGAALVHPNIHASGYSRIMKALACTSSHLRLMCPLEGQLSALPAEQKSEVKHPSGQLKVIQPAFTQTLDVPGVLPGGPHIPRRPSSPPVQTAAPSSLLSNPQKGRATSCPPGGTSALCCFRAPAHIRHLCVPALYTEATPSSLWKEGKCLLSHSASTPLSHPNPG